VLERDLQLDPVGDGATFLDVKILLDYFGHPHIANGAARRRDCSDRCVLPRLVARANDVDHFVDAHAILLGHRLDGSLQPNSSRSWWSRALQIDPVGAPALVSTQATIDQFRRSRRRAGSLA